MQQLRNILSGDITAILRIQAECYAQGMNEDAQVIQARISASPDSGWLVEDAAGPMAYLFAYRSVIGKITPLGGVFDVPAIPTTLYLHDLAVGTRGQRAGLGLRLLEAAWALARAEGLTHSALVSVQGSADYWRRAGYEVVSALTDAQRSMLSTYPPASCYMLKKL